MEWKGILGMIFRLCEWLMLLAYINILWIIFTLLGAIVFGFSPATAAMFAVVRKWLMGKKDIPVFKTFWNYYRAEFVKTNIIGQSFFITGSLIYLDIKIIAFNSTFLDITFMSIMYLLASVYIVSFIYIFPVYVHYDLKVVQYIKNAFLIGIANPFRTILMIICVITASYLLRIVPGLLPFYSGSILCILLMTFSLHSFNKIERLQRGNIASGER